MSRKVLLLLYIIIILVSSIDGQDLIAIPRVKYGGGGDWYNGPTEIPNMLRELNKRAGLLVDSKDFYITFTDNELYNYPILFLTGHGNMSFTDEEATNLRNYLVNGGFLYVDDDYGLDKYFRREIKKVFPEHPLVELPKNHEIYSSYYKFNDALPKIHEHDNKAPTSYGIFIDNRLVLLYTYESNISDGWDDPRVHDDPPEIRELAFKMGMNILIFALTN